NPPRLPDILKPHSVRRQGGHDRPIPACIVRTLDPQRDGYGPQQLGGWVWCGRRKLGRRQLGSERRFVKICYRQVVAIVVHDKSSGTASCYGRLLVQDPRCPLLFLISVLPALRRGRRRRRRRPTGRGGCGPLPGQTSAVARPRPPGRAVRPCSVLRRASPPGRGALGHGAGPGVAPPVWAASSAKGWRRTLPSRGWWPRRRPSTGWPPPC